jgi:hypothetical protein
VNLNVVDNLHINEVMLNVIITSILFSFKINVVLKSSFFFFGKTNIFSFIEIKSKSSYNHKISPKVIVT